eukprot:scaffold286_cov247-Pinguiococcus_pyrenoidosus.AAC.2
MSSSDKPEIPRERRPSELLLVLLRSSCSCSAVSRPSGSRLLGDSPLMPRMAIALFMGDCCRKCCCCGGGCGGCAALK